MSVPRQFARTYAAPLGEILGVMPFLTITGMGVGLLASRLTTGVVTVTVIGVAGIIFAGLFACCTYASKQRDSDRLAPMVGVVLIVTTALVVALGVAVREELRQSGDLADLASRGRYAKIDGIVVSEPRTVGNRWLTHIRVTGIDGKPTTQRAAVLHGQDAPALGFGMSFSAQAKPLHDTGFDRWLVQQHATVVFEPASFIVDKSRQGVFARASETVRARTREAASRYAPADTAGLMVALVTGDRRGIAQSDVEAMRSAGMSHLTAVSGMHLAVYSAGVVLLLGVFGARGALRSVLLCVALLWFVFVTRFQPSVMRAGVMALIVLYGVARGRLTDARYALCVTVLVLLSVDPRLAASVGLQLSATATAGVLLVAPVIRRRLSPRIPRQVRDVMAVTFGAQLMVMPLLIGTFGHVSLMAFPANLLGAMFALSAAMVGFVGALSAVIHPALGSVVFSVATPFASAVLRIARFFGAMPAMVSWRLVGFGLLAGLFALVCKNGFWRRYRVLKRAVVLLLVVMLLVGFVRLVPRSIGTNTQLLLTAIDVGQGDAWLIEYGGVRVMVDAGRDDTAARWMRRTQRRTIDLLVLTHPHSDHIGGALDVLERLNVGRIWMMTYADDGRMASEVRERADKRGVLLEAPPVFRTVAFGALQVNVLNPPPGRIYRGTNSEWNNESIVLKVTSPNGSILLAGDTETSAHEVLLSSGMDVTADVLVVPHHGSATTDRSFLEAVRAHTGVISVGADNPYGHPHREIVAALSALDMRIVRTDERGTFSVVVKPATVGASAKHESFLGGNDERSYRRTVRRVRPRGGRPPRSGRNHPCPTIPNRHAITAIPARRTSWHKSESHQHWCS